MMTPKSPYLVWTHIGRQLKIWNHNGINDTHVTKMMNLWLGYEFVDLMDEKGKIPRSYFNEARKRLGYKTWGLMLNDVRRTQSFYMVNTGGKESEEADYIFSPIWHTYEESDGRLLSGSIPLSKSQKESQKESLVATDYVDNINNIDNPNGVNAAALSLLKGDWPDGNQKKMFSVKKEVVKEYFDWLLEQTEGNHQQLVNDIKYKIAHPLDKDGNPVKPRPKLHISIGPESA